ncbi:sacsin N-terminal ATP-binding-like domain-containing protein [Chitinilyticum piscinae]|uniref:Sacsin/Nov domain-containing protein n=1 Tax=Chitinilyticum piscinae TaxID=2866724 RepID=A0A8J7FML9_9NEIS|nr:hypothetical protein [Chitinilyticum piscinae]MBE9610952.1 hypothetical protein [Chitinilyticum piscinae]
MLDDLLACIRTENLNVYRASPQRLREDVGQESQIAQDYRGRLIYELLQNADDAISSNDPSSAAIAFVLEEDALWVANSGRPLDEADVRGLCGISASSKSAKNQKRRASIGHKGMGFKSVLEISDAPEVYSTTICFSFGPGRALEAVEVLVADKTLTPVARAPVTRFPWLIEDMPEQWLALQRQGMHTAFRFPLRAKMTAEQRDGLAQSLLDLPVTSLVFLKHLSRVEVSIQPRQHSFAWTVQRKRVTSTNEQDVSAFTDAGTYRVSLTSEHGAVETFLVAHNPNIPIENHRGGLDEFTWDGVELTEVSVAARIRNGKPVTLDPTWQKLHVFLPTGEPCPYHLLVSGAFGSNLSRQEIRVEADATNYNRLLMRKVAGTLRDFLIPQLLSNGASVVDVLRLLDRGTHVGVPCGTAAAQALFDEVRTALHDFAFLPQEVGVPIAIATCVVPPIVDDPNVGEALRALLPANASTEDGHFPSAALCGSEVARVLVDHGAYELKPDRAAAALANPEPSRSQLEVVGKLFVDPVLHVLERLWLALDADGRESLAAAARREPLFPVGMADDGTAHRVTTLGLTCFYPPRSLHGTVPLDGLCFLMQEICWGDLTPKERNQQLGQEVATWQALFDVQEFKFPAVMRASVLPALDLERDAQSRGERESLHSLERIAAICQLAGRAPNPGAPLPYERLGTNRALFNLSRLDVPCRGDAPGQFVWIPAYQAYLGSDWVADNSVERILATGRELCVEGLPSIHFLAGPDVFVGLLAKYRHLQEAPQTDSFDSGADEVGLDEDEEAALEGDERSRWLNFLLWLGVNQVLRPVHFHDVEDRASGWLKTSDLKRPEGWIFKNVDHSIWSEYMSRLRTSLAEEGQTEGTTPYFYRLHDLDHLVTLLRAASEDRTTKLGQALYEHLARNWHSLERFSSALVAQVSSGSVPAMRTKPQRAKDEELVEAGVDFWMARLQASPFCPTGHGPRHAKQVWLPTLEVERRFGRRARTGSFLVPALEVDPTVLKGKAKGFAQALGLREELSPATFTLDDARVLLERLRDLYATRFEAGEDLRLDLREVIRPAYRNLFELLSGRDHSNRELAPGAAPLASAPLLAHDGHKAYRFVDDGQLFYMDRRETREHLQSDVTIWSFVMESLPVARTSIAHLFGVPILEDSLRWAPRPGDSALSDEDLERLRQEIRLLAPYLLSRIATERSDEKLARQDAQRLRNLVDCLDAVTNLELDCELAGRKLDLGNGGRDAFVALELGKPTQAFVVWGEHSWPPEPREAEALANALCEVFGAGYFEPFLALIQARTPEDRERLLRRAGAPLDVEERRTLFLSSGEEGMPPDVELGPTVDPKTTLATGTREQQAVLPDGTSQQKPSADIRRVPLFSPGQLLIDGQPVLVVGAGTPQPTSIGKSTDTASPGGGQTGSKNGGYGGHTDLVALNKVGMWVTLSFERNRLRKVGLINADIFDPARSEQQPDALVFDVSSPDKIARARELSQRFDESMQHLSQRFGISQEWPGFDVLTLDPRAPEYLDRLIELKSSGVKSRVQEMSWNEWKSAGSSALRSRFYLYLVGNLRSDLEDTQPFVRTIRNPFEQLAAEVRVGHSVSRKVQLSVDLFKEAEHLMLSVCAGSSS